MTLQVPCPHVSWYRADILLQVQFKMEHLWFLCPLPLLLQSWLVIPYKYTYTQIKMFQLHKLYVTQQNQCKTVWTIYFPWLPKNCMHGDHNGPILWNIPVDWNTLQEKINKYKKNNKHIINSQYLTVYISLWL
jgi:hypothetical protein